MVDGISSCLHIYWLNVKYTPANILLSTQEMVEQEKSKKLNIVNLLDGSDVNDGGAQL